MPNQPVKYEFDLRDRFHRFLKGHRIMVQVQSSWFPVIDRNPQTFVDIYKAKPTTSRMLRTAYIARRPKLRGQGWRAQSSGPESWVQSSVALRAS